MWLNYSDLTVISLESNGCKIQVKHYHITQNDDTVFRTRLPNRNSCSKPNAINNPQYCKKWVDIKDPLMAVVYDWVYHIKYILNMTQHDWPTNSFVDHSNLGLRLEN